MGYVVNTSAGPLARTSDNQKRLTPAGKLGPAISMAKVVAFSERDRAREAGEEWSSHYGGRGRPRHFNVVAVQNGA